MTQEEMEEREFEDWFKYEYLHANESAHARMIIRLNLNYLGMKRSWLTSRRLLRKKNIEGHYDKFQTCNSQSGDWMGGEVISLKEKE